MTEQLLKYLSVFAGSMFKFIFGPLAGAATGLSIFETSVFTALGMMATVVIITYAGTELRQQIMKRFVKKAKEGEESEKKKRLNRLWAKYGIAGVALLTPIVFSPPGGAIIAVSFGEKKEKILLYMLLSAFFWGFVFSALVIIGGEQVTNLLG